MNNRNVFSFSYCQFGQICQYNQREEALEYKFIETGQCTVCVVFVLWYLFWTSTILIYCKCRPDISFCTFEGRSVLSMSGSSFIQSAGVMEREGAAEWGVEGDRQHTSTFSPLPSFTLQVPSTIISSSNSPSSYYTISAVIGLCQTTV